MDSFSAPGKTAARIDAIFAVSKAVEDSIQGKPGHRLPGQNNDDLTVRVSEEDA